MPLNLSVALVACALLSACSAPVVATSPAAPPLQGTTDERSTTFGTYMRGTDGDDEVRGGGGPALAAATQTSPSETGDSPYNDTDRDGVNDYNDVDDDDDGTPDSTDRDDRDPKIQ